MKTRDFTWRVLKSKWFILAAGLWIESIAGAAYTFGVYSQSLKVALGYNQQWLDTLAFFKGIGGNFGVLSGLLYDVAPPWLVVIAGAAECSFGYSMLWLSVTKRIRPAFWQMCIFIGMASNCNTLFSTACVVTNVKNFPNKRGLVIGLLKGFLGLSGAILTQVFFVMYPNDPSSFLLLISWLPAVVSIILAPAIRVVPASDGDNATFREFSTISTCLAACLTLVIILENVLKNHTWPVWIACLSLLGFFLSLCAVIIRAEAKEYEADLTEGCVRGQGSISEPLLSSVDGRHRHVSCSENQSSSFHAKVDWSDVSDPEVPEDSNEGGKHLHEQIKEVTKPSDGRSAGFDKSVGVPQRGEEHTLGQAISSLDFWLLVAAMFCSMGSGTTAIDNMGQIGLSLGYEQVEINTFISLISIWNFLGRFGAGLISELLLHMRGFGRPCCLAFSLGLMCIGHLVMASAVTGSLYVGSIIVGVCYGAQWSLMPAVTSDIFGLRHFGTLYNTIAIASPVAAYILSVKVAGYFYDKEAHEQHKLTTLIGGIPGLISSSTDNAFLCYGPSCFRITFIILALVCAVGCIVCLWLFVRTKRFYVQVYENLHKVE